jgi:hypothetical protein
VSDSEIEERTKAEAFEGAGDTGAFTGTDGEVRVVVEGVEVVENEVGGTDVVVPGAYDRSLAQGAGASEFDTHSLMRLAIERDGAIEVIERLAQLREDERKREAEEAFDAAMAEFFRLCPPIPRDKRGAGFVPKGGSVREYTYYAPFDAIQGVVNPFLRPLGLSYWFSSEATTTHVTTRCILRHKLGHQRIAAATLPISGAPMTSATQGSAGTRSFGKRLTLSDVLGIQTCDEHDGADGDAGAAETVDEKQLAALQEFVDSIIEAGRGFDLARFVGFFQVDALAAIPVARFDEACGMLRQRLEGER